MITLTRLDGSPVVLPLDVIVAIEQTPDTMLSLTTGARVHVREAPREVLARITHYKQQAARVVPGFLTLSDPS